MKHVFLFSFTRQAAKISAVLYKHFSAQKISCTAFTLKKYCSESHTPLELPLQEQIKQCFLSDNIIIFISACGIAVRSIAPFIKSKTTDPCVIVIDELGQYVISLLSGHIGGGNEITKNVAHVLNATPVISTATDLHNTFAVDIFAKKNNLTIADMSLAKEISASLLHNIPVGIHGNIPDEPLPDGITRNISTLGISISPFFINPPFPKTLYLIPKQIVLGIGCKRLTDPIKLYEFITKQLWQLHIFPEAIAAITSIDLKKEEPALLQLSQQYKVPFVTYDAETLRKITCSKSGSRFVESVTGVDNVCERSTLAYTHASDLLLSKTIENGMTLAISELPVHITFQTN